MEYEGFGRLLPRADSYQLLAVHGSQAVRLGRRAGWIAVRGHSGNGREVSS